MADWVFDSLVGFLKSPLWGYPVNSFIDAHCVVFDPGEESKFSYTDVHKEYTSMVENLLEGFMADLGISPEQLVEVCSPDNKLEKDLEGHFEQVFAAENFLIFKSMMVQRNIDLELQALSLLQKQLGHSPEAYQPSNGDAKPETKPLLRSQSLQEEEDKFLEEVLRQSKEEYERQLVTRAETEMLLTLAKEESLRLYQVSQKEQQDLAEKLERKAAEKSLAPGGERVLRDGDSGKSALQSQKADSGDEPPKISKSSLKPLAAVEPLRASAEEKPTLARSRVQQETPEKAHQQPTAETLTAVCEPELPTPSEKLQTGSVKSRAQPEPAKQAPLQPLAAGFGTAKESVSTLSWSELGAAAGDGGLGSGKAGKDISGAEAAEKWLDSARSDMAHDSGGGAQRVLVQVPEDLKAREAYLRRQRDRLLEMRRKERAKKFDSYTSSSSSFSSSSSSRQRPKSAARTVAEGMTAAHSKERAASAERKPVAMAASKQEAKAKSSRVLDKDFETGVLCSTIATRLKEVDQ